MNPTIRELDPDAKTELLAALAQTIYLYVCVDRDWTIKECIEKHYPVLFDLDDELTAVLIALDELTTSEVLNFIAALAQELSSVSFDEGDFE